MNIIAAIWLGLALLTATLVFMILFAVGVFQHKDVTTNNETTNNTTTTTTTESSIPIDDVSGNVPVIDTDHYQLHQGRAYNFSELVNIGNGSNQDYYFTLTGGAHLRFWTIFANTGPITITLYENPTVSADGTEQTAPNMSRYSTNTTTVTLYKGPTVTGVGTYLESDTLFAAKKDGAGSTTDNPLEWILKHSNTYLLRINNGSGGATDVHVKIQWYHTR